MKDVLHTSCFTTFRSETQFRSFIDLKANIREEIVNIPADTLVRVMANTINRFIQCKDNGGRHLPDVIF